MTLHVDLDAIAPDVPEEPSVEFTLGGRQWRCKQREALSALTAERILYGVVQVGEFFRDVLYEDDKEEFVKVLDQQPPVLTLPQFQQLMKTVTEAMFNRPTERCASSEDGPQSTAPTSTAASSSPATGRKRRAS